MAPEDKDEEKEVVVRGLPLDIAFDNAMRQELCRESARALAQHDPVPVEMFITVAEAWASSANTGDEKPKTMRDHLLVNNQMRPSEDPERYEVLILSAADAGGNMATVIFKIEPKKGKREPSFFKVNEEDKDGEIVWTTLAERQVDKKTNGRGHYTNTLVDAAWMEYKLAKNGL